MTNRLGKMKIGSITFQAVIYMLLLIFLIFTFYPFYYCVMLSFNDGKDAQLGGVYFWPRVFTLANYARTLSDPQLLVAARNSTLRTILTTVIAVIFTALFAYGVSRPGVLFRKFYLAVGMITMYFSGGLIPYFLLIKQLGLLDHFLVYIIPGMFSMYNAVIFMSFFKTIPMAMEESAKIDGANEFVVFFRIILPVSTPVLATIALFVGVGQWNSWFDTMLYTKSRNLETLQHVIMRMINTQAYLERTIEAGAKSDKIQLIRGTTTNALQLSVMTITSFPIIVAYPFLQKYFMKGIMIGSIKG